MSNKAMHLEHATITMLRVICDSWTTKEDHSKHTKKEQDQSTYIITVHYTDKTPHTRGTTSTTRLTGN